MCGILCTTRPIDQRQFADILKVQHHRGPDSTRLYCNEEISVGHNRLSIIDLSQNGAQPMFHPSGNYAIIFNGEIYNYIELSNKYLANEVLQSRTDTEVLLHLLVQKGRSILQELIGMFALVFIDFRKQTLLAVRDRFGVKPLYYSIENGLTIASEIKTIHASGIDKIPNEEVWASYFMHGQYGAPHQTFWRNVHQLPGGHTIQYNFQTKTLQIDAWYNFVETRHLYNFDYDDEKKWLDQYLQLMHEAVALRFRSDVPVGINLSGGVDSSILFKTITQANDIPKHLQAFTFFARNEQYDELPWVKVLLHGSNMHLNEVLLTADVIPDIAAQVCNYQDEPYGGFPTLAYSLCFMQAKAKGVKVLLDGQGIDEVWAGYDYYHQPGQHLVQGTQTSLPTKSEVLHPDLVTMAAYPKFPEPFNNRLQNLQYRDLFFTKIPRALRFNDRISMMHSVELREPFLDHRMVEMAFFAPLHYKFKNGVTKFLLRNELEKRSSTPLAFAPKRPIQTPQREWLRTSLSLWAENNIDALLSSVAGKWFNKESVQQEWNSYLAGESDNSFYIWQWINTSIIFA